MKRILVAKGFSKYNVLRRAADEVVQGFITKGYEVKVTDIARDGQDEFLEELSKPYDFIFSCQAIGFDTLFEDGTPLVKVIQSPYIAWIFDDVLYHQKRIQNVRFPHTFLYSIDRENVNVIQKMFPKAQNIFYMPHGGFERKTSVREKDIDVLFSGNLGKKPVFDEMIPDAMPIERFLVEESVRILEEKPYLSVRKAVEIVLNQNGEQMTSQLLIELERVIYYLDVYVRYYCKYNILSTLLKNHIQVHVVGDGSDELINAYPQSMIFHGGMDIDDVVDMIGRAKIVINPVSTLTEGMHERILTAMLGKAACFTPYNPYLESVFGEGLEYIYLNNLSQMTDNINYILNHYNEYKRNVLEKNYICAKENHTWKKRGEQIVEFFEQNVKRNQEGDTYEQYI